MQKPITVKAYGLIPLTKQTYSIMQLVVLLGLAPLLMGVCVVNYYFSDNQTLWMWLGLLTVAAIIGEVVETVVMLRKFKQKEKQLAATGADQPDK